MRRLLLKMALFSLPFVLYGSVVVLVDPYGFFNLASFVTPKTRHDIAYPNNYALWTVLYYDRQPGPNILLGDSRMAMLDADYIKAVSGLDYKNLGMAGASSIEVVNLFWHIARQHELRDVVIGLNFDSLNKFMKRDQVNATVSVEHDPLLYFTSRDVVLSSWQIIEYRFFGRNIASRHPSLSKAEFWREELEDRSNRRWYNFEFDDGVFSQYREIAAYCRKNGIRLRFVTLPVQDDAQQKVREFGFESEWREFPGKLRQLGQTFDFDNPNAISANRDNYSDPFHLTTEATHLVIDRIWASNSVTRASSDLAGRQ